MRISRKSLTGLGALLLAAAIAGCSPLPLVASLVPDRHMARTAGLAYGPEPRQRLNVYAPLDLARPAPVVVFLYGGRWQRGTRDDYRLLGTALTRRGFVVVVPDYRLYPDVIFPAWVEDGARAVRWTRDHILRYGGDPGHIVVVGHSAGAHTAALLALDERWLRDAGVEPGTVRGVVSIAGPVDTTWTDPDVQALMGPREGWPRTYPATHVNGAAPPLLLLHGDEDDTVAPVNSTQLARRIDARGGCARAILYEGLGHVSIIASLSAPWLPLTDVIDEVAAFVEAPRAVACPARGGAPDGP